MITRSRRMVSVRVVALPALLSADDLRGRVVVVFDVLRATTTMAAALAAGVKSIRIVGSIDEALRLKKQMKKQTRDAAPLLCGERNCLRPPGFDLGNSPGALERDVHAGRTLIMATTNGTRAIRTARTAPRILIGALVNAKATAAALAADGRDITLLCAGTNGQIAMEDLCGAGAVIERLARRGRIAVEGDVAAIARELFKSHRNDLASPLRTAQGGRNVIAAGLGEDVTYAARLDSMNVVGEVLARPLRVGAIPR